MGSSQTMRLAKAQERKPSEGERMTALQMLFSSDDDEEQSMPNVAEASGWTLGGNPTALDTLLTSSVDSLSTCEQDVYCASNAMMSIEPLNHSTVFADSTLSSDGISISSDDSDSLYLSDPPEPGPSVPAQFPVFGAEPYSHFIYFAVLKLPEGALQHHVTRMLLHHLYRSVHSDPARTKQFVDENQQLDPEHRILTKTRKYFEKLWFDGHSTRGEYNIGEYRIAICELCCETRVLNLRSCCKFPACIECLAHHASSTVMGGYQTVSCPNYSCRSNFTYDEIVHRLTFSEFSNARKVYLVRSANIKKKSHEYLCPNCGHILPRVAPIEPAKGTNKETN